jgi:hypothetical protein
MEHNSADKEYLDNDQTTFEDFVKVVNSQYNLNKNGIIRAVPIITIMIFYGFRIHGTTDVNLFDAEMKYLYDNNFTVLTRADLGYDESTHQLYIKPLELTTQKAQDQIMTVMQKMIIVMIMLKMQ